MTNATARKLLDLPDRIFADGPPLLEDIIRFNASRGEYGPGDVEDHVAKRMGLAEGPPISMSSSASAPTAQ